MEMLCCGSSDPPIRLLLPPPKSIASCNSLSSLKQSHAQLLKFPTPPPSSLYPKLIAAYAKLGDLSSALSAFASSPHHPDAFSFNALIQSHNLSSLFLSSLRLYIQMISSGVPPNQYTFPPLFKACSSAFQLPCGAQLHAQSAKLGYVGNPFVAAAAMDMYMKNGEVGNAQKVFDGMSVRDVVAWNALLTGYSQNGRAEEVLAVYDRMRREGVGVGSVAAASIVAACSQLRLLHQGKWIHAWVVKSGFSADTVISTALLDMYANCGELRLANEVFEEMHTKDLIAWNCLVSCYAQYGLIDDAFQLFINMQNTLKPNGSSLAGLLPAVARSGTLHLSKSCHSFILRNGMELDEFVLTALMDAYAKSGDLSTAHKLFDTMPKKSVVAWSAIITGYGTHGCGMEAMVLFDKMLASNVKPNHVTYVGVLSACVHSGFVEKGREYFLRMVREHGITPRAQHFTCMVDLLSRAGLFNEAMDLINGMPVKTTAGIWGALLGGCKIHQNVELGKYAADRLFELSPSDPGFYVLLSNIYATAGMWSQVRQIRNLMRERNLRKPPGWSSIEMGSRISYFVSGDTSHPDSCEIYHKLGELLEAIGKIGYVPEIKASLHDAEDDVKENVLKGHSEKLAMAYGLLRATPGMPIRIMKNLRTCEDCHAFAKYVSKVAVRDIILRDNVRFHHIKDGTCTCRDYW